MPNTSGIHRINALKYVWLPTRVYLLRALFYTCGAEPDVAKLTECVSALEARTSGEQLRRFELRTDLRIGRRYWAMLSITKDCLTTAEGGKPDDTVLAEKVKLLIDALMKAVTAPQGPCPRMVDIL